nr:zinc finger protein 470-like [Aedes albopictus]
MDQCTLNALWNVKSEPCEKSCYGMQQPDTPAEELYEVKTEMIVEGAKLEINCHDEELSDILPPTEPDKRGITIDRPFKCDVCPKTFQIKRTLYVHKRFTHGAKEHCCPICGKPIAYRHQIERHMQTHDPIHKRSSKESIINTDVSRCEICQKTFSNKAALGNHNIYVHKPRDHECEICGFRFRLRCRLMKHMQGHERKKQKSKSPSQGSSISSDQKVRSENNLRRGKSIHSCLKCSKQYTSKTKLNQHIRSKHPENSTMDKQHVEMEKVSNANDNCPQNDEMVFMFEVEVIKMEPE